MSNSLILNNPHKSELVLVWVAILMVANAHAFTIVPESDFENSTLVYCEKITDNKNETLECLEYHLELIDFLKKEVNHTVVINITKKYYENRTVVERYNITKSYVVNQTIYINHSDNERQLERDHEFRMKQLELGHSEDSPKTYSEEELAIEISKAISERDIPDTSPTIIPTAKNPFGFMDFLGIVVLIGVGGFIGLKFLKQKRKAKKSFRPLDKLGGEIGKEKSPSEF